ncbi:MAG: hypothetical protein JWM98_470 [Thermoleophilia bacterium]|nr:hypothetical protein [Thermoleophilia bacterium]
MRLTHPRAESGFTLIELLVAMVLGLLVLGLIVGAMVNFFSSSERSGARAKAQRSTVAAAELITSDVRSMHAPDHEPRATGSPDSFRDLLMRGRNPLGLRIHDITVATPTRFAFYAEQVNTSPGPECIQWLVAATGALQREVRAGTGACPGGALLATTEVMPAPATAGVAAATAAPSPFTYELLAQPTPAAALINPDACTTSVIPSPASDLQRDQVIGVRLSLKSFVVNRTARGDQHLLTSAAVSGRQSQEYHYALGCVA